MDEPPMADPVEMQFMDYMQRRGFEVTYGPCLRPAQLYAMLGMDTATLIAARKGSVGMEWAIRIKDGDFETCVVAESDGRTPGMPDLCSATPRTDWSRSFFPRHAEIAALAADCEAKNRSEVPAGLVDQVRDVYRAWEDANNAFGVALGSTDITGPRVKTDLADSVRNQQFWMRLDARVEALRNRIRSM